MARGIFRFWRRHLNMEDVPCPTNDQLRLMGLAAATADDPKRRLLDLLDEACKFSPPNWLIEDEFREIWKALKAGRSDPADEGKTDRQLKAEYREIADRRVRLGIVIAKIGGRNGIDSVLRGRAYEHEVVDLIFGMAAAEQQ